VQLEELVVGGAFAIEKLRRVPSLSRMSMYCPGMNMRRSFAGSFR
jgi:hypothetical protein